MTITKKIVMLLFVAAIAIQPLYATRLAEFNVVDRDYLVVKFQDGIVTFVDDGLGQDAYHGHSAAEENSVAVYYGEKLDLPNSVEAGNWLIKSADDANYGDDGIAPVACYRKSIVNGMKQGPWSSDDWSWDLTREHYIYLELPHSLVEGSTYTVEIADNMNADTTSASLTWDIFTSVSEAVHTNLVGYISSSRIKSADLYHYMGAGGYRDYKSFEGNDVYIYNVDTGESQVVGSVSFWMEGQTETNHNLTGGDVWNADFTGFSAPGTYRIAVEGVGCSQDFEIRDDIYHDPYKLAVMGYFYMRIGQDNLDMTPVPRRPLWIQDQNPSNCKIYVTDMHPYHAEWNNLSGGDKWDAPAAWAAYKKAGEPTNPNAIGGHSDALDWDRHLGHVTNVYDLCLAYIVSDGALDDDDLRIAESGNGVSDILDEVRNEVDFWLNLRYGAGYSHGLTNPDDNNALYQSDNTPIAAWANALNSSMLAYCYQIAGQNELRSEYLDSAMVAYNYANNLDDPMWNTTLEGIRGIDFKMNTAAFLYNLTGDSTYEDVMAEESMVTGPTSGIYESGYNQLWGTTAYLLTQRPVHYPDLQVDMKTAIIAKAKSKEANRVNERPSRRGYSSEHAWWQTSQDMLRTVVAHTVSDNPTDQLTFLDALTLEADWGLGRNPLNMIQMTTASTELADKRSVENCYTAGRDDGTPGLHPGHTPYLNTQSWGGSMAGSDPGKILKWFYPTNLDEWPHASKYINTRYMWAHSEFTPRQTMRGKAVLYAYLYSLSKSGGSVSPELVADAGPDIRVVDEDEDGSEMIKLDASSSYSSTSNIVSYEWTIEGQDDTLTKVAPTVEFNVGSYNVTLKIKDADGDSATDQLKVDVVAFVAEAADYNFETDGQLDDWAAVNTGQGGTPLLTISTEQAHSGSQSVKISGDFDNETGFGMSRSGALDDSIRTIVYYVWVPQAMVDSATAQAAVDETTAGGLQNYLMFTGWQWRSAWFDLSNLQGDAWNKLEFEIPEDVSAADIIEIGMVCTMQSAGVGESSLYVDDITFVIPEPPADYDFETSAQFSQWSVENWGANGGNTSSAHSTGQARSGEYSLRMFGDFSAESEHTLRRNSSLGADVVSLTYHVWVPQVLVDSALAVWQRDTTLVGGIQNYVLHTNWDWASTWHGFQDLKGDDWNELQFVLPENVNPTNVQAYGLSFKTLEVAPGEMSVYVDDIYLNRDMTTAVNDPNQDIANIPTEFKLFHNYPNPFNPVTTIKYNLPVNAHVSLTIYDITGRMVTRLINGQKSAGSYQVEFDASNLASGVYFYELKAGQFNNVRKMLLIK